MPSPTPTRARWRADDGVEIAYATWGEPGDRPPVALHHGFIANATTNWEGSGVIDALTARGRWVVAPDARGHGASDKPRDPARYGEARMSADLFGLLDHLGVGRFDLAGYSMGAIVVLLTAAGAPERVRRLVVGGVGGGLVELGRGDRGRGRRGLAAALRAEDPATITDPGARAFRDFADAMQGDRAALAAQAEAAHRHPIAFEHITADTLVIAGRDDPLAARPEILVDRIANAHLKPMEGDHLGVVANPAFAPTHADFLGAGPEGTVIG